jgi:3-oxoacyl-[acyl-carrier protein] reductase
MSDTLVEIAQNPWMRDAVKSLGLPIPMPEKLRRPDGPYEERPLEGRDVVFGAAPGGGLSAAVAGALVRAGANPHVVGDASAFEGPAEAWGRPLVSHPAALESAPEGIRPHALVFDASGLRRVADVRALYDFFHPWVRSVARGGRLVVLGRPPESARGAGAAAACAALDGFVRSLAKEVGRRGATANVLYVKPRAEGALEGPLRFFLTNRSAFVTGQPLTVDARVKAPAHIPLARTLANKTALVTGAARGIGRDTARTLAAEGAHVICLDRPQDAEALGRVAAEVGGSVLAVDLLADDAAPRIVEGVTEGRRGVDLLINNAGITRDRTIAKLAADAWDATVGVNLEAVARVTEALNEQGLNDGGRVVCLSSVSGIAGNVGQTAYSASKAGVVGYVGAMAPALAKRGITINAIAPGFIETRLTAAMPPVEREVGRRLSALGQGGEPRDVAEAITFLCTPGAHGITGRLLRVCGGMFIGA